MVPGIHTLKWSVNSQDPFESTNKLRSSPFIPEKSHNILPSIETTLKTIHQNQNFETASTQLPSIEYLTKTSLNNSPHFQTQFDSNPSSFPPTLASPLYYKFNNTEPQQLPSINQFNNYLSNSPISPVLSPYSNHQHSISSSSSSSIPSPHQQILPAFSRSNYVTFPFSASNSPISHHRTNNQSFLPTEFEPKQKKRRKNPTYSKVEPDSHSKTQSKTKASTKGKKKSKQNLLVDISNIHYPVHHLTSETMKLIPEPILKYLNSTIYPKIETKKYSTSAIDSNRNYLTVYEYTVNDHWIIWDYETGFVHLTGIWKASLNARDNISTKSNDRDYTTTSSSPSSSAVTPNHLKADIVKLLESTPKDYQSYIKRIRGGFLKIQGTWLPIKLCKILARRFCYHIRFELVPIFGEDFPQSCLKPNEKGFGELKLNDLENFKQEELPEPVPLQEDLMQESPLKSNVEPASKNIKIEKSKVNFQSQQQQQELKSLGIPAQANKNNKSIPLQETFTPSPQKKIIQGEKPISNCQLVSPLLNDGESSLKNSELESNLLTNQQHNKDKHGAPHKDQVPETPTSTYQSFDKATNFANGSSSSSYMDFIDIVNASKCLQSLSNSLRFSKEATLASIENVPDLKQLQQSNDEDQTDLEDDGKTNYENTSQSIKNYAIDDTGITSILKAAELNSQLQNELNPDYQKHINQAQKLSSIRESRRLKIT
ncbi:uncharacterized protein KGF55_001754 [Candida pseudojiufengensis]|uniref:uncharacterized protein n=1 Tax=Candida pseudojiufengensis TaxID=497109 RepID=UPI0022246A4A|nr:uncharacterized protein KGF55_001754 [Candida pseudojiufengensis]KAI5964685.1 hypothetical protein KGF55_001754 [Candida pseudojiufengensis]